MLDDAATDVAAQQLQEMKVTALQKRAISEGVDAQAADDALDDDDPKAALIALITASADSGDAELRRELESLRLKELRARARRQGVDDAAMEEAIDSDDPRQAFVELLLRHKAAA